MVMTLWSQEMDFGTFDHNRKFTAMKQSLVAKVEEYNGASWGLSWLTQRPGHVAKYLMFYISAVWHDRT